MALIKSNQLIQTGTSVVAGDQIMVAEGELYQPSEVERLVPAAPPEVEEAWAPPPEEGLEAAPPEDDPPEEPPGQEDAYSEPEEQPEPAGPDLIGQFDAERDEVLDTARMQAETAAQEATGHLGAPDAALELEGAEATLAASYPPGSAAYQTSLGAVTPYIEQQAAAALEVASLQAAQDARWRELETAEEQIAGLVDNFARRVMLEPPPELMLHSLLAEREALLSEARLTSQQLLAAAEEQAAQIVHQAHAQASQVILDIESRRQTILEELKQQGYAEGYQEGRSQADEEGARLLQELMDAMDKLAGVVREEAKKNEEKLLDLALGIAEKLVMDEVQRRPELVMRVMEEALLKVSDTEEVIIKIHPDDLPVVQEREEAVRDRMKNVRKLEIQAHTKIQPGSVSIDTASGSVDAQFKTQLSVFREAFMAVKAEYGAEPLDMTGSG